MGQSPILSVIHMVTIGTMLNFIGFNNGHGQKHVTFKHTYFKGLSTFSDIFP